MICIIGVNHKIQHDGFGSANKSQRLLFSSYLEKIINTLNIEIVVEEFNKDSINKSGAKNCVVRNVAYKFKLKHIFCEPSIQERCKLGILSSREMCDELGIKSVGLNQGDVARLDEKMKEYFFIREKYWFEKIVDFKDQKILMVIGATHITSFIQLLETNHCDYKILNKNWCFENEIIF